MRAAATAKSFPPCSSSSSRQTFSLTGSELMWPNQLTDRSIHFAALLCIALAVPAAHAQCTEDDNTSIVYVDVTGCTALPEQFDVVIGDQTVPVTRSADKRLWSGTAAPFVIGDGKLARADLPGFRTSCAVVARPENDGPCVARYRLQCEPVYRVFVQSGKQATIDYKRQSAKTYGTCETPSGSLRTPSTLAVGSSDTLQVSTTTLVGAPLEGTLKFEMFQLKPKWTMFEIIDPDAWKRTSVHTSPAAAKLRELTIRNLEFIKQ